LVHNKTTNIYKLYVPKKEKSKVTKNKKTISSDLGKRTFATCLTENEVIEIGREDEMKINKMTRTLNKLKETKEKVRRKRHKMRRIRRKIKNMVDELHWKTINFMTSNYGTVIVGDIKTQEIVRQEGKINGFTKDIIHALRFYKFKQRLEYKCESRGIKFIKADEYGTSKICSVCGTYNDIGGGKIYECTKCNLKIDRDINPTRTFIMLSLK
jgi:putative transposase